jgi:hypothetical protein
MAIGVFQQKLLRLGIIRPTTADENPVIHASSSLVTWGDNTFLTFLRQSLRVADAMRAAVFLPVDWPRLKGRGFFLVARILQRHSLQC